MRNKNRTAIIDWFIQRDWELAITLTFKKDFTEHRARKTMRRLWNGIDRQPYHKAFIKQGKRVEWVCVEWHALPHCRQLVDNVINLFFITFLHNRQCLQINNIQESKDLTKYF